MQTKSRNKLVELAAFALLAEIFYFYNSYVKVGGFNVGYQYIGCIFVVVLGLSCFLVTPDPLYLYRAVKASGTLILPYIAVMLCTAVIWIFNFTPVRQMISGFFEPSYIILSILCAAFLVYAVGERAVDCAFWALSATFGVMTLQRLLRYGAAEYIRRLIIYIQSGGKTGGGVSVEDTSFAYLYAFFALYFLLCRRKDPMQVQLSRWGVTAFALLAAFKRSALLALAVGAAVAWFYQRMPRRHRKIFINAVVVSFVLGAFFVIPTIRLGLFTRIVNALQIDTSARTRIYAFYEQYYEFSPFYVGKGLGWIGRLVASGEGFKGYGLGPVNVHCDYVRYYIELGFAGYLCWVCTAFAPVVKGTVKGWSPAEDAAVLGVCVMMAMLRLTENISQLYSANLGISVIVIQCCMHSWKTEEPPAVSGRGP